MKTIIVILGVAALLAAAPAKRTFTGVVTDQMCVANHSAMNVKPDAKCVRECVKAGSQYALIAGGSVYTLANAKSAGTFASQKVKVSGALDEKTKTIQVDTMTPAK